MKQFAKLIESIDSSSAAGDKMNALLQYLNTASDNDKLWMVAILFQRIPKRIISSSVLKTWAIEASGCPEWLYQECYNVTGDPAEACAGIMPPPMSLSQRTLSEWMQYITEMGSMQSEADKAYAAQVAWQQLNNHERFIFNKLITGGLRTGVKEMAVVKAIARYSGLSAAYVQTRLSGTLNPADTSLNQLLKAEQEVDYCPPFSFAQARVLEDVSDITGSINIWQPEWKWDGLRAQIIKRHQLVYIWSGDTVLITDKFPELVAMASAWPDGTVADGEILIRKDGLPGTLKQLQTRMNRKTAGKKLQEEYPVFFMCFDLLEHYGEDIRAKPLKDRRQILETFYDKFKTPVFGLSEILPAISHDDLLKLRSSARGIRAEGLVLKPVEGKYPDESNGDFWWKWKAEPYSVFGVMLYAQRGNARNTGLFTDFTIGVWQADYLVPVARIHGGFSEDDITEINAFIKANAIESFGPVKSVKGELVFEIAFESIDLSSRHKSGIILKAPKMIKWHKDKAPSEAHTLEALRALAGRA